MGWGDEIIATGQAREMQEKDRSQKVMVLDRHGAAREHEAWENNPRIATRRDMASAFHRLKNAPGHRPYIAQKDFHRWTWRAYRCPVGEIYLSDREKEFAAEFDVGVVIEPWLKDRASPNKDWGRDNWLKLSSLLISRGIKLSQMGPRDTRVLPGVQHIETPTMRHACAVLARAQAAVLPEGGLHHAAAALGIKSIVIFGGFIAPSVTGYAAQRNLYVESAAHPNGCGMRIACAHCAAAMKSIEPVAVADLLMGLL